MCDTHFDTLIVGAGLSGISAGYHLQTRCPNRSYAILEARHVIGGTWDLFRYPGVRSDSDMYTLGYSFRPWTQAKSIADGASILQYVRETAQTFGIDRRIRFNHRVQKAAWSSEDARWTVTVRVGEAAEPLQLTCNFLLMCSGYYNYSAGYAPEFPGARSFRGRIVHPQRWSEDIEYEGKRVVVIGSGATAVTLVPEMAKTAAHVTMLQRSPTYVVSRPAEDRIANGLRRHLPPKLAYGIMRWRNVLLSMLFFKLARRYPKHIRALILKGVRRELDAQYDVDKHFAPSYNPWDQRLCLVPDGDLFAAIKQGRAAVVTDAIDTFTETGLRLRSGAQLAADLIVTATGLNLELLGGLQVSVDGRRIDLAKTLTYKGMMYSDVPNLASAFGYTNASWTLKCDLTCEYVCRLLNYMAEHDLHRCTPRRPPSHIREVPLIDFSSGYVQRAIDLFPKQGVTAPWKLHQNYALDLLMLKFGSVNDAAMEFA